jgi:hypothetical protein
MAQARPGPQYLNPQIGVVASWKKALFSSLSENRSLEKI